MYFYLAISAVRFHVFRLTEGSRVMLGSLLLAKHENVHDAKLPLFFDFFFLGTWVDSAFSTSCDSSTPKCILHT